MLVLLLLADESLLRRKGHDCHANAFIDPVIDDPGGSTHEVETVTLSDCDESNSQQIVFGNHFANIQSVVEALDSVDWRTASHLLNRNQTIAPQRKIPNDFCDE